MTSVPMSPASGVASISASAEVAVSEAIVEVAEASVEVAVAIATEAVENTELVHSVSDMPIRKF